MCGASGPRRVDMLGGSAARCGFIGRQGRGGWELLGLGGAQASRGAGYTRASHAHTSSVCVSVCLSVRLIRQLGFEVEKSSAQARHTSRTCGQASPISCLGAEAGPAKERPLCAPWAAHASALRLVCSSEGGLERAARPSLWSGLWTTGTCRSSCRARACACCVQGEAVPPCHGPQPAVRARHRPRVPRLCGGLRLCRGEHLAGQASG